MTQAVQQFLAAFDSMAEGDKHAIAVEVLRRTWPDGVPALSDDTLVEAAESLFSELDQREASDANG
jgi:hypothetical protein